MIYGPNEVAVVLAEWTGMYNPTAQQAEHDRRAAFQSGVPHGMMRPGLYVKAWP
jgi:hypothetical protein